MGVSSGVPIEILPSHIGPSRPAGGEQKPVARRGSVVRELAEAGSAVEVLMRQTYMAKPGEVKQDWRVIDASGVPLGRLASDIAILLMGKHRPEYTPHVDCGDWVIVTNARQVAMTGRKGEHKFAMRYSEYPGGLKRESYAALRERRPERLVELAVRRMLPKSRLGRVMLKRLKVYGDATHPHQAQQPVPVPSVG